MQGSKKAVRGGWVRKRINAFIELPPRLRRSSLFNKRDSNYSCMGMSMNLILQTWCLGFETVPLSHYVTAPLIHGSNTKPLFSNFVLTYSSPVLGEVPKAEGLQTGRDSKMEFAAMLLFEHPPRLLNSLRRKRLVPLQQEGQLFTRIKKCGQRLGADRNNTYSSYSITLQSQQ